MSGHKYLFGKDVPVGLAVSGLSGRPGRVKGIVFNGTPGGGERPSLHKSRRSYSIRPTAKGYFQPVHVQAISFYIV